MSNDDKRRLIVDGVAIGLSVVALVISGLTYLNDRQNLSATKGALAIQHDALQVQREDLEQTKRQFSQTIDQATQQFSESGPTYALDPVLKYAKAGAWANEIPSGKTVAASGLSAPWETWIIATVTNTGRSAGSISAVGLMTSKTGYAVPPIINCAADDTQGDGGRCELPRRLDVGETVVVYIKIDTEAQQQVRCSPYVADQGLTVIVLDPQGRFTTEATEIRLPTSGDCLPTSSTE